MCVSHQESNERIHSYVRATRVVVMKLRKSLLATNEEIKSLNRGKEALEKALEHRRKDLALNQQSAEIRSCRPTREKVRVRWCTHVSMGCLCPPSSLLRAIYHRSGNFRS